MDSADEILDDFEKAINEANDALEKAKEVISEAKKMLHEIIDMEEQEELENKLNKEGKNDFNY